MSINRISFNENDVINYNSFSALLDPSKWFKWNNFGHKSNYYRSNTLRLLIKEKIKILAKIQSKNKDMEKEEREGGRLWSSFMYSKQI